MEFLKDGLHVWTEGNTSTDKAAEYVGVPTQGIPATASLNWIGTQPQPGSQIVFDVDSDRTNDNTWNILVGEPVYGDDFWYPGGTTRALAHGVTCRPTGGSGPVVRAHPSAMCAAACSCRVSITRKSCRPQAA